MKVFLFKLGQHTISIFIYAKVLQKINERIFSVFRSTPTFSQNILRSN